MIEIYGRYERAPAEGLLHCGRKNLEDLGLVLELDLGLGRMDVHVHIPGPGTEKYIIRGIRSLGNELVVSLHHGPVEIRRTEKPAVYEEILIARRASGIGRIADETGYIDDSGGRADVDQLLHHVPAFNLQDPLLEGIGLLEIVYILLIVHQPHAYFRTAQGHMRELGYDLAHLRIVRLQELPSGRKTVEYVPHCYIGTFRHGRLLLAYKSRRSHDCLGAGLGTALAGTQRDFRHRSD